MLKTWLKVPSMMRVATIEVSRYVANVVYFCVFCPSAQSTSCSGYTTNVCVNSLARLQEGNLGIYAEGSSIAA